MKSLKKLVVFVLALSLLLSSFAFSAYADENINGDNSSSNSDIGLNNDMPPKRGGNSN